MVLWFGDLVSRIIIFLWVCSMFFSLLEMASEDGK
jgi:hypothetical protein